MLLISGLSLKNLHPRVWDPQSPYYLPQLRAVMVSYADFCRRPAQRRAAMERGLHAFLGVPSNVKIYLDNGAFYFLSQASKSGNDVVRRDEEAVTSTFQQVVPGDAAFWDAYDEFVTRARPDWYPIPWDWIPGPHMTVAEQQACLVQTMAVNQRYVADGYVPVVHISQVIDEYITAVQADDRLAAKPHLALGGIVPNLLRMPKARPYREVLASVARVRQAFADKCLHLFGIGGTATLHIAALLGMDSVDSSGWRNRAARGIIQLPGTGERLIAQLGAWRGRRPSEREWTILDACVCPACRSFGREGLMATGVTGFANRATHNLWVLLEEVRLIEEHLAAGTYQTWYSRHLDNTIYRPLIDYLVELRFTRVPCVEGPRC